MKDYILRVCERIKSECDYLKSCEIDQFTIMRLSLLYSISDSIYKHWEAK